MHSRCPSHLLLSTPPSLQRFSYLNLRLITAGFLVGVMLCATVGFARAQNASSPRLNPAAERLTQELVALNARHHRASPAEQARLLSDLLTTAANRQQLLASLIEDNPGEVLRAALPAAIRASLPPAVQAYVEEEVEIEGELQVLVEDYAKKSRTLYFLETAGERLALHFAADPPTDLLTGSQVHVKGVRVDGVRVIEDDLGRERRAVHQIGVEELALGVQDDVERPGRGVRQKRGRQRDGEHEGRTATCDPHQAEPL